MSEADLISSDLPCISCGYNLRTLARSARCPECGADVVGSLEPPLLGQGPRYVERQIATARQFSMFLGLGAIACFFMLGFLIADNSPRQSGTLVVATIAATAYLLARTAGGALVPPPREIRTRRALVTRASGWLLVASTVILTFGVAWANADSERTLMPLYSNLVVWSIFGALLLVSIFSCGVLSHFSRISAAAWLPKRARLLRVCAFLLAGSFAWLALLPLAVLVPDTAIGAAIDSLRLLITIGSCVAMVLFPASGFLATIALAGFANDLVTLLFRRFGRGSSTQLGP